MEESEEMEISSPDDDEGDSGEMIARGTPLKMNKQKTVDPSKMGNMLEMKAMLEEEDSEMDGLALHGQSSARQDHLKNSNRKKHNRRTAKEINRQYICPYKNCQKIYGSEGSLNLHIKIKHNGGNKTDREKLAKTIIMAHMKGQLCQVIDQIDLNLPPGTITKAAKKYGLTGQVEHQVLQQIY